MRDEVERGAPDPEAIVEPILARIFYVSRLSLATSTCRSYPRPSDRSQPFSHPTPLRIAATIAPSKKRVVTTVTSHSCRLRRNMGRPIRKMEPKKRMR